jgi:hypothetical protein
MEENKENPNNVGRWRSLLSMITLVFFMITIALLIYIVILYVPLKEECLKCSCSNSSYLGSNLTEVIKNLNATP